MSIFYGQVEYDLSDHKPINGLFEAKIKVVDQLKKEKFITEIMEKLKNSTQNEVKTDRMSSGMISDEILTLDNQEEEKT